jgi:hypothetical protein
MTVRRNGTDTGTLKTRMGFLIRGQAQYREVMGAGHAGEGGVPATHCQSSPGPFYFAWGCFRDFLSEPCGRTAEEYLYCVPGARIADASR